VSRTGKACDENPSLAKAKQTKTKTRTNIKACSPYRVRDTHNQKLAQQGIDESGKNGAQSGAKKSTVGRSLPPRPARLKVSPPNKN
jgi:hypothetical protein